MAVRALVLAALICLTQAGCGGNSTGPGNNEAAITYRTPAGTNHEMVLVPAGAFLMGGENGALSEMPAHRVELDGYYIDTYEVTVAQYRACVQAGGCPAPGTGDFCTYEMPGGDTHPADCLTWNAAQLYCDWAGLRLPTEAQWEKAARGTDGRTYPWGEGLDRSKANYGIDPCPVCAPNLSFEVWQTTFDANDGYLHTAPVGSYGSGVSPYGAYDMAGNAWEYVSDWYDSTYYAHSVVRNPPGPEQGAKHIMRGGGFDNDRWTVRAANRNGDVDATTRSPNMGFRCARVL